MHLYAKKGRYASLLLFRFILLEEEEE